ncbi:Uncharacterized protein YjbI, contains pentapeptide repeats [Micromonospora pattaloongensis]|uniref:Uncharacterized protein YjbI, contains pentapeptide repeats n=1 Tax=Micromonospora pattaloongensis TaxID=405436 RepID=A0A1H3R6P2_9ACTN|nr:pentapeptide repeat-containing protein [Micromonospora pattaloongensis]SDZ21444.1 Uncharacterized protein YjbI, contains pentapeptide repeats [Micromonospora pattaloongensis]
MDKKFWKTAEGVELARSVFARLLSGQSLDRLSFDEHEGRLDLRNISVPSPTTLQEMARRGEIPEARAKKPRLQNVSLEGIDFSGADLRGIRLFEVTIRECRFDEVQFDDLRVWKSTVRNSSFRGAKLAGTYLGAWHENKGNEYTGADFQGADLTQISCPAASFQDVNFSGAKIIDVDFGASSFVRCTFAGELRRVIFWDRPPTSEKASPNPMTDIDFSRAELHDVEFRGLRLDRVTLPRGDGHVIVRNYRCVLERGIERLKGNNALGAVLVHELHWSHPLRTDGVWHRDELGENDEERDAMSNLLNEIDAECGQAGSS